MKAPLSSRWCGLLVALCALGLVACSSGGATIGGKPTLGSLETPPRTPLTTTATTPRTLAPIPAPTTQTPSVEPTAVQAGTNLAGVPRRLGSWGTGVPVALALSADGAALFVAGTLRLRRHDAHDLAQIRWEVPLDTPPAALALSPDGAVLALAVGMQVELRSPADGALLATLRHDSPVSAVAFSPDSATLAATTEGETLRLWDLAGSTALRELRIPNSGEVLTVAGPLTSVSFAPDGARVAAGDRNGNVAVWPIRGEAPLFVVSVGMRVVADVAFSPDGNTLAAASAGWRSEAGAVWLWNATSGAQTGRLMIEPAARSLDSVKLVRFSDDSATVVAGTASGALLFWSWPSGQLKRELKAHRAALSGLAITPGGGLISAGRDGDLRRWNAEGTRIDGLDDLPAFSAVASGNTPLIQGEVPNDVTPPPLVRQLEQRALCATGGEDGSIILWSAAGQQLAQFAAHTGQVNALAISPDGSLLASAGDDGAMHLWSLPDGAARGELHSPSQPTLALAFSPDGKLLASTGWDGTLRLWAMPTGAAVTTITALNADGLSGTAVLGVTFANAGAELAATAYDGTVRRFRVRDGTALPTLATGAGGWLIAVAVSPRGDLAALDDSGLLWAWNASGTLLGRGALADATALAPLSGGRLLTVGPSGGLHLWALAASGPFELAAAASAGDQIAATSDGQLIAISSRRGFLELWSLP